MGEGEVLAAADANMVEAWRRLVAVAPAPGVVEAAGVVLLSSGLPVGLLNPAFVTAPPADPGATVGSVVDHYAGLGLPFALYFRDGVVPGLAGPCRSAGLVEHWQPPVMVLDPIPDEPAPSVRGLEVRPVDHGNVEAFSRAVAAGFGLPRGIVDRMLGAPALEVEGFTGLVGTVGGAPVTCSGVFVTGTTAGVYSVGTDPRHRGRGYGAAMTWAAVRAGRDRGATRSILQASEQGVPVYARMGFVTVDRYRQFEPSPAAG